MLGSKTCFSDPLTPLYASVTTKAKTRLLDAAPPLRPASRHAGLAGQYLGFTAEAMDGVGMLAMTSQGCRATRLTVGATVTEASIPSSTRDLLAALGMVTLLKRALSRLLPSFVIRARPTP
jgi:hypothetical protein